MRRGMLAATVVVTIALTPGLAAGQGWTAQPNGEAGYAFPYGTTAIFTCAVHDVVDVLGACSTAPGSVTFAHASGSVTLTFTGSAGTFTATNEGQLVQLGAITPTFTGSGPFVVGAPGFEWWPAFHLTVSGTGMGPYLGTALVQDGAIILTGRSSYLVMTPPPNPSGPSYPSVIIDQIQPLRITDATAGPVALTGSLALVPEPATYLMLGTGLLMLGGIGVARRRI